MDDVIMPKRKEITKDKKYVSISLHADLVRKVDEVIDTGGKGYDTRAEVVKDAIRRFLEQLEAEQRMEHLNVYEDHVIVRDNVLNRTVFVYLRNGVMTCDLCESNDCLHTRYVQTLPQVKEKMENQRLVI